MSKPDQLRDDHDALIKLLARQTYAAAQEVSAINLREYDTDAAICLSNARMDLKRAEQSLQILYDHHGKKEDD